MEIEAVILALVLVVLYIVKFRAATKFPGPPRVPLLGSIPWLTLKRGPLDWSLDPLVTGHKVCVVQGWKFMSCSHCQELCQQASWLLIGCTRVNNQPEARSAS